VKLSPLNLIVIFLLLAVQLAIAAPDKNTISEKILRLAMLDLDRYTVNSRNKHKGKNTNIRAVEKQSLVSKRRNQSYPANCLTWDASQINSKAKRFEKAINDYSRQYHVDKNLIKAIITVESCFKVKAKSHADARGLMQLIPATAERFGVKNIYNPRQNIRGGVKYLKFLQARYKGDLKKILAAYNAGEGIVDKHKGIPPYKETQKYVQRVLEIYARLNPKARRVSAVYNVAQKGKKPGRYGWEYNRSLAPHLYKK